MEFKFTKLELQLLYFLLDNEYSDLLFESEQDPLFNFSLASDRLLRVKLLRDKISLFIERIDI